MRRFFPLVLIGILLAGVLTDPYTYAYNGSDLVLPAPIWQLGFAILDLGMLLAIAALSIRGKVHGAMILAESETVWYLVGNTVLYMRDGPARFIQGFGGESNLAEHLIVLVLRLVLIVYLFVMSSRSPAREGAGSMTRAAKTGAAIAVLTMLIGIAVRLYNPLWRSETAIEAGLRSEAPEGTSIDRVRLLTTQKGWRIDAEWSDSTPTSHEVDLGVTGDRILFVYMGRYQGIPWRVDVDSFWGFDRSGRLIDIHVRKSYDAP